MWTRAELLFSVKYPFSSATKDIAKWLNFDLASSDPKLLERAKQRALQDIESGQAEITTKTKGERKLVEEILSYALAKIMVARTKDRFLAERFAEGEANNFRRFLLDEPPDNIPFLAKGFGLGIEDGAVPFVDYLRYLPRHGGQGLANAQLKGGMVRVGREEIASLLPEKLKAELERDVRKPMDVPPLFDTYAGEIAKEANREKAFKRTEDFGAIAVESFPPCMKALITDAQSGEPMAHQPRFTLSTFLANIGMPVEHITDLFRNTPNFNEKKTRYYIEYSMGKRGSGVKYSPPSCEKMVFYGLCRNKDALCERVRHPLSYYAKKKGVVERKPASS